jgi:glycosyltransferase involved in cell wall biosynthesis
MKIVHVEDYFDPDAGYQINELVTANNISDEVSIITSYNMDPFHKVYSLQRDLLFEERTGAKIIRLKSMVNISSRLWLKGLWRQISLINPDLLFLHGIGDFKDLILFYKKMPYKIIRDCHMSWIASQNPRAKIYFFLFRHFFSSIINKSNKYEVVFALGIEEHEYLKRLGIREHKIKYLLHGYNASNMYFDPKSREEVRKNYEINKDEIVISYIGKFDEYKRPDLIFDIIGNIDFEVLSRYRLCLLFIGPKDEMYMKKFREKQAAIENSIHVIVDGAKDFNSLRNYYSASDICIFPKQTTLSSIHAQVCRCPVIMENHASNYERVVNNANLFPQGNYKKASDILVSIIERNEYLKENNGTILSQLESREYSNQVKMLHSL